MLLETNDGSMVRSPEQVPQSASSGKWKLGIAALAVTAALAGWCWHSTPLSEVERQLVGNWEDGAAKPWVFHPDRTVEIGYFPENIPLRQGNSGADLTFNFSIDYDWRVEGNVLILRQHVELYERVRTILWLKTAQRRWNQLLSPETYRIPIISQSEQEVVLQNRPAGNSKLFLQPRGSSWPSPTQLAAAKDRR